MFGWEYTYKYIIKVAKGQNISENFRYIFQIFLKVSRIFWKLPENVQKCTICNPNKNTQYTALYIIILRGH